MTNGMDIAGARPDHDPTPSRRSLYIKSFATLAFVGLLAGCTASRATTGGERNAPASAPYSLDANPGFYHDAAGVAVPAAAAGRLDALEHQAVAEWLQADDSVTAEIGSALIKARRDGSIPMFVSYAIPNRDNGGQSQGGLSPAGYKEYIDGVARTIGDAPSIVVLEPDALAQIPDLASDSARDERLDLLAVAIDSLHADRNTAVYLDAGNATWRSPDETARLLGALAGKTASGIPGIALNVSNYVSEADTRAYARAVETLYGKPLYVMIDNSRNGAATAPGVWCNPAGQRLGSADAVFDARARVETAFIKTPGESDGADRAQCQISQKPAGEFDPSLLRAQLGVH